VKPEALAPAVEARLVEVDEQGCGSAIRWCARQSTRRPASGNARRAHAALTQVLADQPDRRAWHRAASILGPDEAVAAELEQVAARAQRRGALGVAAAALERAARLGSDSTSQGSRLLRAAELAFELGRRDQVVGLLQEAEPLQLAAVERGRMLWIREVVDPSSLADAANVRRVVGAATRAAADGDHELAVNLRRAAARGRGRPAAAGDPGVRGAGRAWRGGDRAPVAVGLGRGRRRRGGAPAGRRRAGGRCLRPSARRSVELVSGATLKVYPGAPMAWPRSPPTRTSSTPTCSPS
jgi:hypothetical protein